MRLLVPRWLTHRGAQLSSYQARTPMSLVSGSSFALSQQFQSMCNCGQCSSIPSQALGQRSGQAVKFTGFKVVLILTATTVLVFLKVDGCGALAWLLVLNVNVKRRVLVDSVVHDRSSLGARQSVVCWISLGVDDVSIAIVIIDPGRSIDVDPTRSTYYSSATTPGAVPKILPRTADTTTVILHRVQTERIGCIDWIVTRERVRLTGRRHIRVDTEELVRRRVVVAVYTLDLAESGRS